MKLLLLLVGLALLFALSWPLALLVLALLPVLLVVYLVARLLGIALSAVFALLKTVLFLPARLFGYRG